MSHTSRSAVARALSGQSTRTPIEVLEPRRLLAVTFSFEIQDDGTFAPFYDQVLNVMEEAGRIWGELFDSTINIEVDVFFQAGASFLAAAAPNHFETLSTSGGVDLVEVGPVNEIRTGIDPNGIDSDASVFWSVPTLSAGEFFFSTDDERVVPGNQFDALTVILHELGHVVGFYALKNDQTGEVQQIPFLDNRFAMTTFDQYVTGFSGFLSFAPGSGSVTQDIFGPVPLVLLNISHYGTEGSPFGQNGASLDNLLMSAQLAPGQRMTVAELDVAMLADIGLPLSDKVQFPSDPVAPILHLTGSIGDDTIEISRTSNVLLVTRNFETFTLPTFAFDSFVLEGFDGRDYIVLHDDIPSATVLGGGGADTIIGTNAGDTIHGGAGGDVIVGKKGADHLVGNGGRDRLVGDEGDDTFSGGAGIDTIIGGAGADYMLGGTDPDLLIGDVGNDRMFGDNGSDTFHAGGGDDYMNGGSGGDYFDGDAGRDTVDYSNLTANLWLSLNGLGDDGQLGEQDNLAISIDLLIGGSGHDKISGDGRSNWLYGGAGKDSIDGGSGDDRIFGEGSNDVLQGQAGNDRVHGGGGNDRMVGGGENDAMFGGAGNDWIMTNDRWADVVDGGSGTDSLDADSRDSRTSIEDLEILTSLV